MRALDMINDHPVLTAKRLADLLNVTVARSSRAVGHPVEAGILSERAAEPRNRIFAAREVLTIVDRLFGHPPALNKLANRVERKPRAAAEG